MCVGPMGSGKTTWLRATIAEIDASAVITTIESDFELNVLQMGKHPYVIAYQERLPTTIDSKGYTPAEAMRPAMRTRADWIVVGEVRGGEGAPLVRAMQTGQGAMGTVHGGDAADALDNLVNLIASDTGQAAPDVKTQVYRAIDLVVALEGTNAEGRWVSEIAAPSVENAGERFVLHRIYGGVDGARDERARPINEPQANMLRRLRRHDAQFSTRWWSTGEDTYKPLQVIGPGRCPRRARSHSSPGCSASAAWPRWGWPSSRLRHPRLARRTSTRGRPDCSSVRC